MVGPWEETHGRQNPANHAIDGLGHVYSVPGGTVVAADVEGADDGSAAAVDVLSVWSCLGIVELRMRRRRQGLAVVALTIAGADDPQGCLPQEYPAAEPVAVHEGQTYLTSPG